MTTTRPSGSASRSDKRGLLTSIVVCFFFSGFSALLYEIAWLRQFAFVVGTSEVAVAIVLGVYLAGLTAGAILAARYVGRIGDPIWTYGLLEAGIAGAALAVPLLLAATGAVYVWTLGGQPEPPAASTWGQPLFHVLVALGVLGLPTALMGATLPVLTRSAVGAQAQIGARVALLYGSNTLGAVCGAIAAGYALIPAIGLTATVLTGVIVNLAIFGFIATLKRGGRTRGWAGAPAPRAPSAQPSFFAACMRPLFGHGAASTAGSRRVIAPEPAWVLPVMLLSGATALIYEVLWTRMLAHTLGDSLAAVATMLAAFLGGIALGSGLGGGLARDRARATIALIGAQIGVAVLSMLAYSVLAPTVPATFTTARLAAYAAAVMLPGAVFLGASFPLAVRVLASDESRAGTDTARVYAWNTAGAVAGAMLAGFVLLPALGFEGTMVLAAAVNFALALSVAVLVVRPRPIPAGIAASGLLATLLVYSPSRPDAVVESTVFPITYNADPQEIYYGVGRSATVLMLAENGYYYLRANGLPEASIPARGAPPVQDPEKWLTALPVAARPDAETLLLIGFGGGVALEGAPPSIGDIDVIELEAEIIEANRAIADQRNDDPLQDPRVTVVENDARNAMRLTSKRYDVIVSQPSHPWTSAAAHLYTREFFAEAKSRLTARGVFVQWINSEFVDESLLRTLAATLRSAFGHVRLYQPGSQALVFLASDAELTPELQLSRSRAPLTDDIMHYSRLGMNGVEDLLTALVLDDAGLAAFAGSAPVSTDDNLLMATRSRDRADGLRQADLAALFSPFDPLVTRGSWVYSQLAGRVDFGYITRNLVRLDQTDRAVAMAGVQADESTRLLILGLLYAARGQSDEAAAAYRAALEARPENAQARYLLIEPEIPRLALGNAEAQITALTEGLPASAGAVVLGWAAALGQDWQSLAGLDTVLGRAAITDAWYVDGVRLRAEWRSKVTTERAESLAFDALRLIDRAILFRPERSLYLLRAAVGIALGDGSIAVESSRHVVRLLRSALTRVVENDAQISGRDLLIMRQNLNAVATNLRGELVAAEQRRAEEVRRDANELLRVINAAVEAANAESQPETAE